MKKMIKLSLVAAVAVAGLTTTASATAMEDAIKNTDLSGYIRYRYTQGESTTETNNYKTVFKVKSKVNDNVSAFIKVAGANSTTDTSGDADPDQTNIKEAKFIFNIGGATVIAGKQGLATPFADAADQQGTGIVALYPVSKALTLAAGWYGNSDAKAAVGAALPGNNIAAVAAIGSVSSVNYAVWYADIARGDVVDAGAKAINVNVSAKIGPVNVEVNHASVNYTDTLVDQVQTRLVVSGKAGPATLALGYVKAGSSTKGADVTLGDSDASANFLLENLDASSVADTGVWYAAIGGKVGAVALKLEHGKTTNLATDAKETKFSAAYAMSKNFKVSAFVTNDNFDSDTSRIEIKYTF
jgi:hypothetical protein